MCLQPGAEVAELAHDGGLRGVAAQGARRQGRLTQDEFPVVAFKPSACSQHLAPSIYHRASRGSHFSISWLKLQHLSSI